MKLVNSRHVVIISDKVWEDTKIDAIRKHKTLGEYVEQALIEKLNKKEKSKSVDNKKGKKID